MSLLFCGLSVRSWNLITSLLHLGNGVAIVALRYANDKDLLYGIQQSYPDWSRNASSEDIIQGEEFFVRKRDIQTYELSLTWLIAVFFFLSFAFQLAAYFPNVYSYEALLKRGRHPLRFIEYSISSPLMVIAIALLSGIFEHYALLGMFFAMFSCNILGLLAEHLASMKPKEKTDEEDRLLRNVDAGMRSEHLTVTWIAHVAGWLCVIGAWLPVLSAFSLGNSEGTVAAPDFVYVIIATMFVLFNSFGINQLLELSGVYGHETAELVYITLSLTSKSLLGWMIFANVLAPM
jgi:hypothetical protein